MPETLKKYCPEIDHGSFEFPWASTILNCRIVVATLMTSDRLFCVDVPAGHFTHLFVDEAGHATEPLLMLALNVARGSMLEPKKRDGCKTQQQNPVVYSSPKIVIAGDHRQLGPHVNVKAVMQCRLGDSPLLRIYNDAETWEKVGRKLLVNYRSHPAIVDLVNAQYDDELVSDVSVPAVNTFAWLWLTRLVQSYWQRVF